MNSHRDNVKAVIDNVFRRTCSIEKIDGEIADAVFDALGITSDEQDKEGGYWMLHAKKGKIPELRKNVKTISDKAKAVYERSTDVDQVDQE
jgi:hypothetical protein